MNVNIGVLNPNPYDSEPFIFTKEQIEAQQSVRAQKLADELRHAVKMLLQIEIYSDDIQQEVKTYSWTILNMIEGSK